MTVNDMYKELQEEHASYSPRNLCAWANVINMKTLASLLISLSLLVVISTAMEIAPVQRPLPLRSYCQ